MSARATGVASLPGRAVGGNADGGDAAGVDDPRHPGRARRVQHVAACPRRWSGRAAAGRAHPAGNPPPRETGPRSRRSARRARRRSVEIAGTTLSTASAREVAPVGARAHQRAHLPARCEQRARDRRTDETGGTGHQCPHASAWPRRRGAPRQGAAGGSRSAARHGGASSGAPDASAGRARPAMRSSAPTSRQAGTCRRHPLAAATARGQTVGCASIDDDAHGDEGQAVRRGHLRHRHSSPCPPPAAPVASRSAALAAALAERRARA